MKTIIIGTSILLALAMKTPGTLSGVWESVSPTGAVTRLVVKSDNSFEGFINKKPFVTGTYTYTSGDGIFSFIDNGCNGARGTYKIDFYGNGDSLRFEPIEDSCTQRKEGMKRLNMGRIK